MSRKQENAFGLVFCELERCNTAVDFFFFNLSLKREKVVK